MLDELLGEERVARGSLTQPRQGFRGERPAEAMGGQYTEIVGGQGPERDLGARVAVGHLQCVHRAALVAGVRAGRHQQHERDVGERGCELGQVGARLEVGPLHVLHLEHQPAAVSGDGAQ